MKLKKQDYYAYIKSPAWQETRKRFWASKLSKHCVGCGVKNVPLDLHHKSYKTLGRENLNHLALVCRDCHNKIHVLHSRGFNLWGATSKLAKSFNKKSKSLTWPLSRQGALKSPRLSP